MSDLRFVVPAICVLAIAWPQAAAKADTLDRSRIDALVESVMASSRIPGVALGIVHGDQVVYLKGYGDAGNGGPVTPQTPFYLASVSKPITALAVMQLVEAGKVELDQPVQKYLPEFQLAEANAADRLTVRHLLSHISGISTFSGRQHYFSRDISAEALAGYVRELKEVRPTAPVGTKFQYSNTNYTVLARLVEVASGMPFEQYVRDRILMPLGMSRTCFSDAEASGAAVGYRYWFGRPVAFNGLPSSRHHLGATGVYSSAEDLSRFLIAQLNDGQFEGRSLLSPKGIEDMHRPAVEIRPKLHYALGWDCRDTPSGRYVGHAGDWAAFHADLVMSTEDRWGVVVLVNVNGMGGTSGRQLADALLDQSRGRPAAPPPARPFFTRVFGPMLKLLPLVQVILAILFYRRVRRWRRVEEERPRRWWLVWVWHGVVVLINLALAVILLIVLPAAFDITLRASFVFAPDITWLLVISAGIALPWCVIRTALVIESYRAFGGSVASIPAIR